MPRIEEAATGKTVSDLIWEIGKADSHGRRLVRIGGMATLLFVLLACLLIALLSLVIGDTGAVDIGSGIVSVRMDRRGKQYQVAVHPQGWQDTGIEVGARQRIVVHASGSVCVDLEGLVEHVTARRRLEQAVSAEHQLDHRGTDPKGVPEAFYSIDQLELLRNGRGWTGPDGYEDHLRGWRERVGHRLVPDAALGALIGQLRSPAGNSVLLVVGGYKAMTTPIAGRLWVSVNDVVFPPIPDLFFKDNLGSYQARIDLE